MRKFWLWLQIYSKFGRYSLHPGIFFQKFATLSRANAEYIYLRQSTLNTIIAKQKCDDQIWMNGRRILQEITDNESTPAW
jgi:hypothetical protein